MKEQLEQILDSLDYLRKQVNRLLEDINPFVESSNLKLKEEFEKIMIQAERCLDTTTIKNIISKYSSGDYDDDFLEKGTAWAKKEIEAKKNIAKTFEGVIAEESDLY